MIIGKQIELRPVLVTDLALLRRWEHDPDIDHWMATTANAIDARESYEQEFDRLLHTPRIKLLAHSFYRVDPVRVRTEGNSSGLGLSIVEWVVQVHGGSIMVESQVGQGSTFTVTLPIAPSQATQTGSCS